MSESFFKRHEGAICGVAAALSLSIMSVLIKASSALPDAVLLFARFAISWVILIPWMILNRIHLRWKEVPKHILRGAAGVAAIACYFYALLNLPLVNAIVLSSTSVLFMPIVIFIWSRLIIPKRRVAAGLVGFIGVLLSLQPQDFSFEIATLVGLVGGCLSSIALYGVRQLSKTESTMHILSYYFAIATVIAFFPAVYSWVPIEENWLWLSLLAIGVTSSVAQYCLTRSFTHLPATRASAMTYLGVVFGGLAGWWLWAEIPGVWELIGMALIVGGGLFAALDDTPERHWKN
jgi:drug/metabolite transporter (DMT)-like permease